MFDKNSEEREKKAKQKALQKRYVVRITTARKGREAFLQKNYITAAAKYTEYLNVLADLNELHSIYELSPSMFDNKKQITEMLLISHVYWELARIYETTDRLSESFEKCLEQFVKFTINQPYQVLNSEMLRRYNKKHRISSPKIASLETAYKQIFTESRKCFIATMCFDTHHPVTLTLRDFKQDLIKHKLGMGLVRVYYLYSSRLVSFLEKNYKLKKACIALARLPLILLAALAAKRN